MFGVFDPYRQVPHDSLHSDMLGISKHMAMSVRDSLSKANATIVNSRIRLLAQRGLCNTVNIFEAATWNGRDLRQFSRIGPVVLAGISDVSPLLLRCYQKEAELIWYLTFQDWCTSLESEFISTYKKQRYGTP